MNEEEKLRLERAEQAITLIDKHLVELENAVRLIIIHEGKREKINESRSNTKI